MRRIPILLAAVVMLGIVSAGNTPSVIAQDDTETHLVAGTWTWVNGEGEEVFPSIATFGPDGSYIEVLPWGAIVMGVWQPTGERTATVTQVINYLTDDGELVQGQGRAEIEVDASGNTMTWRGTFLSRFQDGRSDIVADADDPGSTSIGTRLEPQAMASLDELMLTPVPFGTGTPVAGATPTP